MPIDHFSNASETFKNRYWVNATYYQSGGPVFREILLRILSMLMSDTVSQFLILENKMPSHCCRITYKYVFARVLK